MIDKKQLKTIMRDDLVSLHSKTDEKERALLLKNIAAEQALIMKEDEASENENLKKERLDFEREKFDSEKESNSRRLDLEFEKVYLERERIQSQERIEQLKAETERKKIEAEEKKSTEDSLLRKKENRSKIIGGVIGSLATVAVAVVPALIYFVSADRALDAEVNESIIVPRGWKDAIGRIKK